MSHTSTSLVTSGARRGCGYRQPERRVLRRPPPRTIDFQRITPASRLLLADPHADIANAAEFPCEKRCPCRIVEHVTADFADMCARLWWEEPLEAARHRFSAQFAAHPMLSLVSWAVHGRTVECRGGRSIAHRSCPTL